MKYAKKQLIFYIVYLLVGASLFTAAFLWSPQESKLGVLSGIVGGFLVTGLGGIILNIRLMKNPSKAQQVEIAKTEERNQFLNLKTQASVNLVVTLLISAGAMISLLLGYRVIALTLASILIVGVILYIFFGMYYAKKY